MDTKKSFQVQNALNLVLTIKEPVKENYEAMINYIQSPEVIQEMAEGVTGAGLVHFARLLPMNNDKNVIVITTYDGSFENYLNSFIKVFGFFFNEIAQYLDPTYPTPIGENTEEFSIFVEKHNIETGLFSAYPRKTVIDITDSTSGS